MLFGNTLNVRPQGSGLLLRLLLDSTLTRCTCWVKATPDVVRWVLFGEIFKVLGPLTHTKPPKDQRWWFMVSETTLGRAQVT